MTGFSFDKGFAWISWLSWLNEYVEAIPLFDQSQDKVLP
jgi:hypothetical protein